MTRALITGGAGFIGSHLARRLIDTGDCAIRIVDNFDTGKRENLSGLDVELIEADLRTVGPDVFNDVTVVFHMAAIASVPRSISEPALSFGTNVVASERVFSLAASAGVRRVICASSAAVYGPRVHKVDEDTPLDPRSPYAAHKASMEHAGAAWTHALGLDVVCMRFFNVYGPRQDPNSAYAGVIAAFSAALAAGSPLLVHGDGRQARDFVHVSDVVSALQLARELPAGQAYNVGTGRPTSVIDIARALVENLDPSVAIEFGDRRPGDLDWSCANIDRLSEYGYRPRVSVDSGLTQTGRWYGEHLSAPHACGDRQTG